jgi:hypothetical protein
MDEGKGRLWIQIEAQNKGFRCCWVPHECPIGEVRFFGIYSAGIYPSLTTADKQLHCHGEIGIHNQTMLERGRIEFWESIANTIAFLEREIPDDTFTTVLSGSPVL